LAFWGSKALLSAVELGVFTELAREPADLQSLEKTFNLHPRSSKDFLDTLVALGMLERKNGVYSNTPSTELFLDKKKPSYVGGILEMANTRLYPFWNNLTTALHTGEPQNEMKGSFEALYTDPAKLKEFLSAMTGVSRGANLAIAKKFQWNRYKSAADVGTAQGDLIVQVALANPHLSGIGFDLAPTKAVFEEYVKENGLSGRVKFAAGNFFEEALPKVDVIMMGHILHDWNLEEKKMLIRKSYEALPKGGAFIAYDSIIDDDRSKNAFGLLMSLNMLVETAGGFDYTGADCMGWMKEAGFTETRVEHLVGPDSMVIGIK